MRVAEDKRTRLLEAAERVFVERGIAQTTVDEITARAGVAKGTFYLYFKSKDELAYALQRRLWAGHLELAGQAAAELAVTDWWTVVDRFLEEVIDYDLAHRDWHRLVAQTASAPPDPDEEIEQEMIELVTAAIRVGMEQRACHADDPEMAATMLYRAVQGTSHQFCRSEQPPDRDRLLRAIRALTRKILAPAT